MDKYKTFSALCDELESIYRKKNSDYGDSFGRTVEKYGKIAALTRIADKFNRLENLMLSHDAAKVEESLRDTLMDMAGYCLMTVMELEDDYE